MALAAAWILSPSLGTAQTASGASQTPPAKANPNQRLLTPEQQGREGMVKGVVEQPFRDFGLVRSKIPSVLIEAIGRAEL